MKHSSRSTAESVLAAIALALTRVSVLLASTSLVSQQSESSWGEGPGVSLVWKVAPDGRRH